MASFLPVNEIAFIVHSVFTVNLDVLMDTDTSHKQLKKYEMF